MSELILHIGLPKTGTTSLQEFFYNNRQKFLAHGVNYPIFTKQPGREVVANGSFINKHCLGLARKNSSRPNTRDEEKNFQLLSKSLSGHERVLLSEEIIAMAPAILLQDGHQPDLYWPTLADELGKIGVLGVTVIVYLRRQDDWMGSRWKERVRGGFEDKPFEECCVTPFIRLPMDYAGMIAMAESAFGKAARIIVRRYDRSHFAGGDIYHDFCAACGIPWNDDYELPREDANLSITFDVAEALRAFKAVAAPQSRLRNDVLWPLALELSKKHPDPPGTTPFNESAARAFMEPWAEGNGEISSTYLDGAPLFPSEYGGRTVWMLDQERVFEYRAIFEKAIREHGRKGHDANQARSFPCSILSTIKQPIHAIRNRMR